MADETSSKPEPSKRRKMQLERMARIRQSTAVERVRVLPRDDNVRALIKHPRAGAFRSSGSVEWPFDTFTKRRIREGVVKLDSSRGNPSESSNGSSAKRAAPPRASESTSAA
jgi:ribosomal protein L15E